MPILDIHVECTGIELSCQLGLFAYVQVVICSREGPYFPFWCCSTSNLFSPPQTSFLPERLLLYAWQKVTCVPKCYLENPYVLRFGAINFFLCHSPSHLSLGIHFSVSLACYYPFLFCALQISSLYFDYFWDIIPLRFLVWAPEFITTTAVSVA